jgi:hypothetical protein
LVEVFTHLLLHKTVKNCNTILVLQMLVTDKFPPCGTELCEKPTCAPLVKNSPHFMKFSGLLVCSQELTTVPMLSQMNPVHEAPFYLCKIHFTIIFPPMLKYSLQSLSLRFLYQNFMLIYLLLHKSHMPHLSHPNNSDMDYKSQRTSLHNFLQLPLISALVGLNILITLSFNNVVCVVPSM